VNRLAGERDPLELCVQGLSSLRVVVELDPELVPVIAGTVECTGPSVLDMSGKGRKTALLVDRSTTFRLVPAGGVLRVRATLSRPELEFRTTLAGPEVPGGELLLRLPDEGQTIVRARALGTDGLPLAAASVRVLPSVAATGADARPTRARIDEDGWLLFVTDSKTPSERIGQLLAYPEGRPFCAEPVFKAPLAHPLADLGELTFRPCDPIPPPASAIDR
jgi:hypothetical protein